MYPPALRASCTRSRGLGPGDCGLASVGRCPMWSCVPGPGWGGVLVGVSTWRPPPFLSLNFHQPAGPGPGAKLPSLCTLGSAALPVDATGEPPGRSEASRTNLPECQQPPAKACSKDARSAAYARISVRVAAASFLPQESPGRMLAGGGAGP